MYTSIDQSRKLLELGLNPETADMYYDIVPAPYTQSAVPGLKANQEVIKASDLPCWSLDSLIRQLPIGSQIDIRKEGYYCYVVWENIGPVESAIEAVTEGIIWLLKKNDRYGKNV